MVSAYILAKVDAGKDEEVFSKIREIEDVREAHAAYGIYDLFLKVNFEKIEDLDDFVFNVMRKIPGIKETTTVITAKAIV